MRILKVVIADDMQVIAKTYLNIVAGHQNYKVVGIANNGQEEYDLIMERNPDLVITDNQMPEMNGIDVIEKIYNSDLAYKPKFILITGDTGREILDKCNQFDVFKMINKPVRDDVLTYTLDEVCDTIKAENPENLNDNKKFDYEKWKEKYYNKEIVDLKKHLSEKDFYLLYLNNQLLHLRILLSELYQNLCERRYVIALCLCDYSLHLQLLLHTF